MDLSAELPPASVWEADPAGLSGYLDWLEARGVSELAWTPEPAGLRAVSEAMKGRALTLTAVLPNMSLYARDAMDAGPTGAVLKRFKALGPLSLAKLGLRLLPRTPALLEKRFAAGILLLADAEFLRLTGLPVRRVALHSSAVDMALALGCRELLTGFAGWARARGVEGLALTSNPWLWERRANDWGGAPGGIAVRPVSASAGAWTEYRPETPEARLAAWKKRAGVSNVGSAGDKS